jgi:hypothetical protein
VSLDPSIGNWSFPCRSHYWIRNNKVRWAENWSQARIDANLKLARSVGIEGTPALVIGGELIPGAVDLAELRKAVTTARGAQ